MSDNKPLVTVTRSGEGVKSLLERLQRLKNSDVLIGIPAANVGRKGGGPSSAELLFIHSYGSPVRNIPPRPVLQPAIKANWKIISPYLRLAAKETMMRRVPEAERALRKAGMTAANAAKRWFTDPRRNWKPLAPATIARKKSAQELVDTGQMRRAITSVLRIKGSRSTYSAAEARSAK